MFENLVNSLIDKGINKIANSKFPLIIEKQDVVLAIDETVEKLSKVRNVLGETDEKARPGFFD